MAIVVIHIVMMSIQACSCISQPEEEREDAVILSSRHHPQIQRGLAANVRCYLHKTQ